MNREQKYIVLKVNDADDYLTGDERNILFNILLAINHGRVMAGKVPQKDYVVVEEDWPMYEATWNAIEEWVDSGHK